MILYILDPRLYPPSADISGLLTYVIDQVTQADSVINISALYGLSGRSKVRIL